MSWFIKSLIRTESVCWSEFWVLEATGPQLLWLYYQKMERKEKKKRWRLFVMTTELRRYRGDVTSLEQDGVWTNWTYWFRHWLWVSSDPAETGTTGTTGPLGPLEHWTLPWCQNSDGDDCAPMDWERQCEMLFLVWRTREVVICHLWCNAVILCSQLLINSVGGTNVCMWAETPLYLFRFKCLSVSRTRSMSVSGAKTCSDLKVSFQHGENFLLTE